MMTEEERNRKKFELSQIINTIARCDHNVEIFTAKANEQRQLKEELIEERVTLEKDLA